MRGPIHKAVLKPPGVLRVDATVVLAVGWQGRDLCVWYEADMRQQPHSFHLLAVPTGSTPPDDGQYLGTAQTDAFAGEGLPFLVLHVYGRPA